MVLTNLCETAAEICRKRNRKAEFLILEAEFKGFGSESTPRVAESFEVNDKPIAG